VGVSEPICYHFTNRTLTIIHFCSFQNAGSVRDPSDCTHCIRLTHVSLNGVVTSHPLESAFTVIHPWNSLDLTSCRHVDTSSDRIDSMRAQVSNLSARFLRVSSYISMAFPSLPIRSVDDLIARRISYWVEITALDNDIKEATPATMENGSMLFFATAEPHESASIQTKAREIANSHGKLTLVTIKSESFGI
jgi:predicted DNA-binding ribbon-helix-helix protein